jgi:REP element-mobilizing transposase RayT
MLPGQFYHVFNHANGWENVFEEEKNYPFFLKKLADHISPVCRIYAYCLMKNHFHLFIQVRHEKELIQLWQNPETKLILDQEKLIKKISKSFANLFSSYTQAFNKVYNRMGSLFIQSMKMELVEGDESFCRVVHYIHANPVHHRFVDNIEKWKHSSYKIFLSKSETRIERDYVLKVFGGLDLFIKYHERPIDPKSKWIDE